MLDNHQEQGTIFYCCLYFYLWMCYSSGLKPLNFLLSNLLFTIPSYLRLHCFLMVWFWGFILLKVYDVTSYVEEHPGGDAILAHAGDDSTEGFFGYASVPVHTLLVCIGDACLWIYLYCIYLFSYWNFFLNFPNKIFLVSLLLCTWLDMSLFYS